MKVCCKVRPDSRKYMGELCSRSSSTPLNLPGRSPSMVNAIREILHESDEMVSAVIIGGSDGTGKSELLVHLYRRLLSRDWTENSIAYFSFEAWDHRRQSVSTMLIKIIQQLLACVPQLLSLLPKICIVLTNGLHPCTHNSCPGWRYSSRLKSKPNCCVGLQSYATVR